MKPRVLLVDDEPAVLDGYRRILHKHFEVDIALGGEQGLALLSGKSSYAVIVSDMRMPHMNGAEFLARARKVSPDSSRMLLTGYAEVEAAIAAVNEGHILRFLTKPCQEATLMQALNAGVVQYQLVIAERDLLENTLTGMIGVLVEVLGLVNPGAFGCATRLRQYVRHMAAELKLASAWRFEVAALLSQIGCVTLDPETVDYVNAGKVLSPEEQARFKAHPAVARDLLAKVPRMEPIAWMIAQQLQEDSKPVVSTEESALVAKGAQMLRTALAFDALLARGLTQANAIASLRRPEQGFPADLVACLANLKLSSDHMELRSCAIQELACGMILREEVRTHGGLLVVNQGQEVTQTLLARLKSFAEKKTISSHVLVHVRALAPVSSQSA